MMLPTTPPSEQATRRSAPAAHHNGVATHLNCRFDACIPLPGILSDRRDLNGEIDHGEGRQHRIEVCIDEVACF